MKDNSQWRGYTLDEIRFQRMLTLMRIEISRQDMIKQVEPYTSGNRIAGTLVGRIAGALNFMDYAMLAITVGASLLDIPPQEIARMAGRNDCFQIWLFAKKFVALQPILESNLL